jgi:hypothetical protein
MYIFKWTGWEYFHLTADNREGKVKRTPGGE